MTNIAFDIGGTYIKSAIVAQDGGLSHYQKVRTPVNYDDAIVKEVKRQLCAFKEQHHLTDIRVGISTAGAVNREQRKIAYANPNIIDYTGTDFSEHLAPYVQELHVFNDVDAALLGELTVHTEDVESIFCLTLGTGIGGSYYHKAFGLMTGARHRPNQIGNLLYDPETGTNYEQRASTNGLKRQLSDKGYPYLPIPEWFERAYRGDTCAHLELQEWAEEVARGIAEIQIMYDPQEIVIGGGISAQGDRLLQLIVPQVEKYLPKGYGHAEISVARLQNNAALIGAVSKL
ncbi:MULTISPECIES: ROK family protein [unclassified Staphylococcus]|uniref:ROK family protein n=1 Tax=unclassified Staphylococcus TaxID=91994 RepID=UPI0021CE382A|nr:MULTISPECIES: ROK family protein [unclassified Staphylococcus]UXR78017.1 ROK family protein [Staphylococcus sp. IVB6227]UXR82179.1 ROK family protein [Staphylococcus sp. IVB6214]